VTRHLQQCSPTQQPLRHPASGELLGRASKRFWPAVGHRPQGQGPAPRGHDAPAPALDRQQGRAAAPLLQPPAQHSSADEAPRRVASRGGEPQCVIGWPPAADGAVSPLHDASVPVLARLSAAHV